MRRKVVDFLHQITPGSLASKAGEKARSLDKEYFNEKLNQSFLNWGTAKAKMLSGNVTPEEEVLYENACSDLIKTYSMEFYVNELAPRGIADEMQRIYGALASDKQTEVNNDELVSYMSKQQAEIFGVLIYAKLHPEES